MPTIPPRVPTQTQQPTPMPYQRSNAPALAFGIGGQGTAGLAAGMNDLAAGMRAINDRNDAVERARLISSFNSESAAELRRLSTEDDLSKPATVRAFGDFMKTKMTDIFSNYSGFANSRAALEMRLTGIRDAMADQAAVMSLEAGEKVVQTSISENLNGLVQRAYDDPSKIPELMQAHATRLDDLRGALSPDQEISLAAEGNRALAVAGINALMERGQFDRARQIMEMPGVAAGFTPDQVISVNSRLAAAQKMEADRRNAGLLKLQESEQILGRKATPAERLQIAGISPGGGNTIADKISSIETALKRRLTPEEKERLVGVAPASASPTDVGSVRKEFTAQSKDFVTVRDAFTRIEEASKTAAKDKGGAGSVALLYSYMKLLDPASVVREGEIATAQNTVGVPDRIRNAYNQALNGNPLSPEMVGEYVATARTLFARQREMQDLLERQYSGIASRSGMQPSDVIVDYQGKYRPGSAPATESNARNEKTDVAAPETKSPARRIRVDLDGNILEDSK